MGFGAGIRSGWRPFGGPGVTVRSPNVGGGALPRYTPAAPSVGGGALPAGGAGLEWTYMPGDPRQRWTTIPELPGRYPEATSMALGPEARTIMPESGPYGTVGLAGRGGYYGQEWQPPGWFGASWLPGAARARVLAENPVGGGPGLVPGAGQAAAAAGQTAAGRATTLGGPGTGGGTWGPAPPGVNEGWWDEFAREHEGQTALEYYGDQGEGLAEALGDLEWSQQFAEMYGRPPTDDDWRRWWFHKRGLMAPEDREALERENPEPEAEEDRPPLWVPPNIAWRQD